MLQRLIDTLSCRGTVSNAQMVLIAQVYRDSERGAGCYPAFSTIQFKDLVRRGLITPDSTPDVIRLTGAGRDLGQYYHDHGV